MPSAILAATDRGEGEAGMPDKEFAVAIPAADEGAAKPRRKLLRALDDSQHGALS